MKLGLKGVKGFDGDGEKVISRGKNEALRALIRTLKEEVEFLSAKQRARKLVEWLVKAVWSRIHTPFFRQCTKYAR